MPITRMFWAPGWGRDLHILRGQSGPNLADDAIKFAFPKSPPGTSDDTDFAQSYIDDHPNDVTLTFKPLINGTDDGHTTDANDLHVSDDTGVVRVDSQIPGNRKPNFIIEVTAKNVADGKEFHLAIRIHVHWKVVDIWITPPVITVRPSGTPGVTDPQYRFTVIAEFDDGSEDGIHPNHTVGDVTLNHDVEWTPDDRFDSDDFFVFDGADKPGDVVPVTVKWNKPGGPFTAQAEFHVAPSWDKEPNPPTASMIAGGAFVGVTELEDAPNILFMSDGFADSAAFVAMTDSLVHSLKTNAILSPYDALASSMFYWRVFIPGPQTISVRSEVMFWDDGGTTVASVFPPSIKPAPGTDFYTLRNLLYVVGLPTPADQFKTPDEIKAQWALTNFPNPVGFLRHGDNRLVNRWKRLGDRAFVDQVDAFPAMSYGRPPAADGGTNFDLELHRDRGYTAALANVYPAIASDDGTMLGNGDRVGALWARQDPRFHFDNRSLVVLLTSVPGGRAGNFGLYIALSSKHDDLNFEVTLNPNRKSVALHAIPVTGDDVSADSARVLAHELGHSFGLGDEYPEFARVFPKPDDALAGFGNLTTEAHCWNDPALKQIVAEQIKWNWHRIAKATVTTAPIVPDGNNFRVPVRQGQGLQFKPEDRLLIRLRTWGTPLAKFAAGEVLDEAKALKLAQAPDSDAIVVEPVIPGSVSLADLQAFKPGSLVYVPTLAKPSTFSTSAFAGLMAPNVMHEITAHHRPLTDVPCDVDDVDKSDQVPDLTNINVFQFPKVIYPTIVGLYEGGDQSTCGIFHPTGTCMMRRTHSDTAWFCAVCRYVMVDLIDPFYHYRIDQGYTLFYPPSE